MTGQVANSKTDSSDKDMSSSSDDNNCDFSRLLQDIKEALEPRSQPGIHHYQHLSQQEANMTATVSSQESNKIHEWQDENSLIMNDKDRQMIEEQFLILQQIEQYKTLSTNNTKDQRIQPNNDNQKFTSSESDKIGYPCLNQPECEGTVVKLIDEIDQVSMSVSSLGASDSSYDDDDDSNSSDEIRCDYSKLLRNIIEAVGHTPLYESNVTNPPQEVNHHRVYNKTNNNDKFLFMDDKDELLIEEQFRILQEIQRKRSVLQSVQSKDGKESKVSPSISGREVSRKEMD